MRLMRQSGVEAVRTGIVRRPSLLTLADTLGLQLYQELPFDYLAAEQLQDSLASAQKMLRSALQRAQKHPSARHFGLARRSETSDTSACSYFRELTNLAHQQGPPEVQTYYLSAFINQDRCAQAVDFVLLDALRVSSPRRVLGRWRATHPDSASVPVGLGTLGTPVKEDAEPGLRQPYSPQRQARYLEDALRSLLADTAQVSLPAFFVYRWQDAQPEAAATALSLEQSDEYHYGLLTAEGQQRPSFRVVRGFFTGQQTTFAFEAGEPAQADFPWLILLGWGVFLLLALCFAFSEQFQQLLPRYFRAHAFYREAIQEGRHSLIGLGTILLVAFSLSFGVIGSAGMQLVAERELLTLLVQRVPVARQELIASLLGRPLMLALLLGSLYAFCVGLWTLLLSVLARRYQPMTPPQVMTLILFAHWWLVPLMMAILVIATLPPTTALYALTIFGGVLLLMFVYAMLRTAYDYVKVLNASPLAGLVAGLVSPLVIVSVVVLFAALGNMPEARFIWSLASREVIG